MVDDFQMRAFDAELLLELYLELEMGLRLG